MVRLTKLLNGTCRFGRADCPAQTVLRSARDGSILCVIEKADISALANLAPGWRPPTPFQGVCADGVTALFALIWWPSIYDPSKRYPVVEVRIHATQSTTHTAFSFSSWYWLCIARVLNGA